MELIPRWRTPSQIVALTQKPLEGSFLLGRQRTFLLGDRREESHRLPSTRNHDPLSGLYRLDVPRQVLVDFPQTDSLLHGFSLPQL
jgi:hypothetical protein